MRSVHICLVCCCLSPVAAQDVLVSVHANGDPARAVLETLGRETGLAIQIDPRIQAEPVSMNLIDRPLREVLDLVCQAAGLVWFSQDGLIQVVLDPSRRLPVLDLGDVPLAALRCAPAALSRPVTLSLMEVPVRDAVAALAEAAGARLAVDTGVPYDVRISATFRDTPLSRCLYMVCLTSGLYVVPTAEMALVVTAPVRVAATRGDREAATVIEHFPDDYHGVLGYLLTDRFWEDPSRYRTVVEADRRGQPRLLAIAAPDPSG